MSQSPVPHPSAPNAVLDWTRWHVPASAPSADSPSQSQTLSIAPPYLYCRSSNPQTDIQQPARTSPTRSATLIDPHNRDWHAQQRCWVLTGARADAWAGHLRWQRISRSCGCEMLREGRSALPPPRAEAGRRRCGAICGAVPSAAQGHLAARYAVPTAAKRHSAADGAVPSATKRRWHRRLSSQCAQERGKPAVQLAQ
jgi:hypothetical protein